MNVVWVVCAFLSIIPSVYGFYAFSGKATSFAGFLLLSLIILITGSQEIGMLVVSLLLIGGIYMLSKVDDEDGQEIQNH